ncbi:hypothetical protein BDU57DRAFT_557654 [Ampelomyces quisqualis]|uniref:NAD(P)-binding protein n=1 Tax=Ampelomyces quisqualis TaxID=50730 RepID=A0A6A5QJB8_AMPQU|nr:hypothetical protein BDU57DRAFT_557654 [Ampelomyces quisqualis]
MSQRSKDTLLASAFTKTQHIKASAIIDPQYIKLPAALSFLVIGASRGIGAGIAYAYAKSGVANLTLAARGLSSKKLGAVDQIAREWASSMKTTVLEVDITSPSSVAELAKCVRERYGKLDIVVFNSDYSGPVVLKVDDGDPQDFQDVFNVDFVGKYNRSGSVKTFIVVNSFAALITSGHIANLAYCISKFAQARFFEFLSEQYSAEGVLAVAVHPGAVQTEMANKTTPESFRPYLTDDVRLCGAFCVWLSQEKRMWLNCRLLGAKWDIDELLEKKHSIEEQDLLKFGYRIDTNLIIQ